SLHRAGSSPRAPEARYSSAPARLRATSGLPITGSPVQTRSALRDIDVRKRGLEPLGELPRVVIGPEVYEEEVRLVIQHVVVNCRNLDPVVAQVPSGPGSPLSRSARNRR